MSPTSYQTAPSRDKLYENREQHFNYIAWLQEHFLLDKRTNDLRVMDLITYQTAPSRDKLYENREQHFNYITWLREHFSLNNEPTILPFYHYSMVAGAGFEPTTFGL